MELVLIIGAIIAWLLFGKNFFPSPSTQIPTVNGGTTSIPVVSVPVASAAVASAPVTSPPVATPQTNVMAFAGGAKKTTVTAEPPRNVLSRDSTVNTNVPAVPVPIHDPVKGLPVHVVGLFGFNSTNTPGGGTAYGSGTALDAKLPIRRG